jgi:AGCS family alanine or glycine:cation symporter
VGTVGVNGEVLNGSALALAAFDSVIPHGGLFVTIALIPFAYSTILGWAYYGEKCTSYLLGTKWVKLYRIFFTILVLPGALLSLEFVWSLANILNGLMAIPNLIGLFLLASVIRRETKIFDLALKREKGIV